ncbi:hypothetical protein AMATHDRAFT_301 [Amanita thiersii Skay4041]|uniref:Uncharacterized protein n=1 Tax=Amanita thiersii Skay4041 TaxID=703135 RepID=A0A2A9P1T0_9AGAR|nr:hypothetical protein AMATHDRAFT_301 [Amanita thiersii Skay4041]
MHLGRIYNDNPLRSKTRIVWDRITFSRLTIVYFCFFVAHFVIQLALQIRALTINATAADALVNLVQNKSRLDTGLPILQGTTLKVCTWVPSNLATDGFACQTIWNNMLQNTTADSSHYAIVTHEATPYESSIEQSSRTIIAVNLSSNKPTRAIASSESLFESKRKREYIKGDANGEIKVKVQRHQPLVLVGASSASEICQSSLIWPISVLRNTKREDIVFISFQFWVLGMSFVALLNESIPHVFASLLTHLMATAWAAYQISNTAEFRSHFRQIIANGSCKNIGLLPDYWSARSKAEISGLALNFVALLFSAYLTWRLIKLFGWQTFKRVGASLTINRIYRLVLLLSIAIQLSFFFMAITVSLWVDRLVNSAIGDLADYQVLYKISSSIALSLLIPWLVTGWFGVRRELRTPMFVFLLLSCLYLAAWGVMFFSTTFRWTFVTWRFFSIMSCASVFLTCVSLVMGTVCRFNFGKGLLRYLSTQTFIAGSDVRSTYSLDLEKVEFPTSEKLIPTYASAFGSSPKALYFGELYSTNPKAAMITAIPPRYDSLTTPPRAHTRNGSDSSSGTSYTYHSGYGSDSSRDPYGIDGDCQAKRWVIE